MKRQTIYGADLFCGAGGTSAGLLDACRELDVDLNLVAINHWEVAIQSHSRNLPAATHYCADLDQVNPLKVIPKRRLNILVAGPECTHHSIARGGRPINDQSRASAWVILKWIQELRIDNVLIENVREFMEWGPLDARGRPMKSRKGAIFTEYLNCLKAFGYNVEYQVLNCANYGDATTRERLFIMARRGRKAIQWPEPTHSKDGAETLFGTREKWRSAREIIDWEMKGSSIYSRKRPLKPKTLARIYAGIDKFCGPMIAEAFLRDVQSNLPTTIVKEFLIILRRNGGARSVDDPLPTLTAGGNHVGLAQFVLQQQSGGAPRSVDEPVPTVATKGAIGLAQAQFVMSAGGPKVGARDVERPLNTVLTRDHMALTEAFVVPFFGERERQKSRSHSVDDPLPTVTSHGAGALVHPFVMNIDHHGGNGDYVRSVEDPLSTQTTKARSAVVQPCIVKVNHGNDRRPYDVDSPMPCLTAKNGYAVIQPCIVKYNRTGRAAGVDEPLDTITTKARFGLVEPQIAPGYQVEVLFRMLQPHELAAAHSVSDFKFPQGTTKADIVKMIGNMVPRRTAKALCKQLLT